MAADFGMAAGQEHFTVDGVTEIMRKVNISVR